MNLPHHVNVCGIRFFICDYNHIASLIVKNQKEKTIIAPLATHPVMEAYFHKELKLIYNNIKYVLPDGYTVWAIRFLYGLPLRQRMYGPDLLLHVAKACEKNNKSIFLCGNNCEMVAQKLKRQFPNLIVAGSFEMKGINYSISLAKTINKLIEKSNSSCVCIGIGTPNQHLLASQLTVKLPIICVGAGFDLIAGIEKQAPRWMRENGMEWLYRFAQNPKRLWRRYIIFGPLFILLILRERVLQLTSY